MDTDPSAADRAHTTGHESEADRHARREWKAAGIAKAEAELDAGLYVDAAEMRAWVESMDTGHELPPPTRHR